MTLSLRLDDAIVRLNAALQRLQAAAEQRGGEADAERVDRDQAFALLQYERVRLADELDEARAEKAKLLAAQEEVFHRLDRAGRSVQGVMQRLAAGEGR